MTFVENIRKSLKYNNEYAIGLFLDLSKAFDTINHDILLTKLQFYGIKNNTLNFFKSYLSDRKQTLVYNDVFSNAQSITCGVPQGSVLGPLLFILYINDMYKASNKLNSVIFADDTNLLCSNKDIDTLVR